MKLPFLLGVILVLGAACRESETKAPHHPAGECCLSYGEMSADGLCMGHGEKCCSADEERAPLCSEME